MKPQELRIGNYIQFNSTWDIERVYNIVSNFKWQDELKHQRKVSPEINDVDIKDVRPIPLTEEWLLNFGFKENFKVEVDRGNEKTFLWSKLSFRLTIWDNYKLVYDYMGGNIEIKYVHQLQNLYYALTGSELQIK